MFFRNAVKWSPVEIDYLKSNKDILSKDQLCIALGKSRNALQKKLKELNGDISTDSSVKFQSKVGLREDLKTFCRSAWEANMMRLFNSNTIDLTSAEYEPQTFSFTEWVKPKGAALSYTPDFRVEQKGKKKWVEVKGNWLRGSDKTKLRRFKKYYPEDFKNLLAVVSTKNSKTAEFFKELGIPEKNILEYNQFKRLYSKKIENWE